MSLKENINSVLKAVGLKAVEVKLEQMLLDDGVTTIEAESFETGYPVVIVTTDNQLIPLPVGEYVLQDGRTLVVTQEGMIESVNEPQATAPTDNPAPADAKVPMSSEPAQEPVKPKSIVESVIKELRFAKENEELKAEIETLKTELSALKETQENITTTEPIVHNPETVELSKVEPTSLSKKGRITDALNNLK